VSVHLNPHPFVASLASVLKSSNELRGKAVAAAAVYQELEAKAPAGRRTAESSGREQSNEESPSEESSNQTSSDEASSGGAPSGVASSGGPPHTGHPPHEGTYDKRTLEAVRQLAAAADLPQLVTFTGYVGATFQRPGEGTGDWTVLYLDGRLWSWLLVETKGIVFRRAIEDERSPFGLRDVIWVKENATVGRGSDSLSIESQFLTGEFSSAGDFEAPPPGGGTLSAATGVFCEGRSPGCCRKTPG
jgi:hypothetical protein